jgi:hypothetical protein
MANETNKELVEILKKQAEIKKQLLAYADSIDTRTASESKHIKELQNEYKKLYLEKTKLNVEQLKGFQDQVESASSLTGIYSKLGNLDKARIEKNQKYVSLGAEQNEAIKNIASLNRDLANTSRDDISAKNIILKQIEIEKGNIGKVHHTQKSILDDLDAQTKEAERLGQLTETQKEFLNDQLAVYEGIKKTIGGILETADILLSTTGGKIGALIVGAGYATEALGKNVREIGGYLGGATISSTLLGTAFDSATDVTKGLAKEMGGLNDVTFQNQLNTNLMAMNMGISGDEAATLTATLSRLNGGSIDTAQNLAESTKELAKQNGLVPAQVMADVAASAEDFALYGKDGGKNILEAAVAAGKLGVNLASMSKVTEGLLDFESSISKELELSAMLGKNINLNKARALAYDGKMGAAVKETISQMGGIDAFNKMDVFQKKAAAEAAGLTVEEFQKMASNLDKLNDKGEIQLSTFDSFTQSLSAFASGPLGSSLKGMGSMVIAAGQFNTGLSAMGINMGGVVRGTKDVLKGLFKMTEGGLLSKIKNVFTSAGSSATPPSTPSTNPAGRGGMMDSMSKVNMSAVLKGAAAMVLVAGAVYILGKALQEYTKVGLSEIGMAAAGMLLLGSAVMGLGLIMSSGVGAVAILAGAAAMLVVAASVYVLGKALQEMGAGFSALGQIQPIVSGLVSMVGGIGLLAVAFTGLAGSLALLGTAGLLALPTLMGLGVAGAGLGMLVNAVGGEGQSSGVETESVSEYQSTMLTKMDDLINAVKTNKDVYLDKEKVTNIVMNKSERRTTNTFGIANA